MNPGAARPLPHDGDRPAGDDAHGSVIAAGAFSLREYQRIRRSAGVVERADLTQIRVWGRDPGRMLNGLITNDLGQAAPARAVYAAMLTPKGRMLADLRALSRESGYLVDLPLAARPTVEEHLKKYVPPLFARWERATTRVLGVYGPQAGRVVREVLGVEPSPEEDAVTQGSFNGAEVAVLATWLIGPSAGFDLFVEREAASALQAELEAAAEGIGGGKAAFAALEVARLEAGRPRFGADLTGETLPAEAFESTGQMPRAVSFTKGCYTGQEVVVRIAHRGHVNRHLRGLLLGDVPLPGERTPLHDPETGKEVGWTTSACDSPALGQAIALGFVRREVQIGASVALGLDGPPATVTGLPFPTG